MPSFRALWLALAGSLMLAAGAAAATPELSVSTRLQDRREVVAGQRSYVQGYADGRFSANGFHIAGEMGGIWAPPLKLADGVWFGIDGSWVGPATRFSSGYGYTRFQFPEIGGLKVQRTDFGPDGIRAALFGLTLTNPGAARTVTVAVDAHSELTGAYPWGTTTPYSAADTPPDQGAYDGHALVFTNDGSTGTGAPVHHYAALVGAGQTPASGTAAPTHGDFRGPQPQTVCTATDSTSPPSACADGPFGHGTGGELRYSVSVPAHGATTIWAAVAGSDQGLTDARAQLARALHDPAAELAAKIASRVAVSKQTQVSLPGDRLLQHAIDWGKQNLADLTQTANNLQIRWTDQGTQYPAPLGTVPHARWFAAGYPDYPWIFATDAEYTAYAAVGLGQFQTIEDHLLALRDVSQILNGDSGIVAHETVSDGSVYFGQNSQSTSSSGTTTNNFNTDEAVKLPSTVALIWRWTGDTGFMRKLYDFVRRGMHTVDARYDVDRDGWPEGSGNVERPGMGPEKLDNGVYYMRGLYDLADMARFEHDTATARWATGLADRIRRQFEATWWDPAVGQYADSLIDPGNQQSFQKHWIGVVPMEAELSTRDAVTPGVAVRGHALTALAARETPCFSGSRPGSLGLFHTGCGGGADGKGDFEIFSLTTSIMAVGLGNYGLLGPGQQQRYTDANAETMFAEPATGGTPDEQPGAMPEIFPSSPNGDPGAGTAANIDRCWTCRSQVMQAWGNYGTVWPVVHQQLGLRPFLPAGQLDVVPQVPPGQPSVAGSDIRLGTGSADVFAGRVGQRYTTTVALHDLSLRRLVLGVTLPEGSHARTMTLDGRRVRHGSAQLTNRGLELTVPVSRDGRDGGPHTLVVAVR
ncbi:MAG: glycogen debranching protein [Solirubrobacteraceae bacterium]